MKRLFAVLICGLISFSSLFAQQLQTLEDTDTAKQQRDKINKNFTLLNQKITTAVGAKEDPLVFSRPLARTGGTISCPTCLAGEINADSFESLAAALAAIGSTPRTLTVSSAKTVSANLTVPANVALRMTGDGVISIESFITLTIEGPFDAPVRAVFPGPGAVKFMNGIRTVYPQWFGAKMDGTDDGTRDTPGIQKAIDSFPTTNRPHAGGEVPIRGAIVNSTVLIDKHNITLVGNGWGIASEPPFDGFMKWNGRAGIPEVLIRGYNSGVRNLRMIGNSSARPSAAIEYNRPDNAVVQSDNNFAERVWIGSYFGYDSDHARQFDVGILMSGNVDNDTNDFKQIMINDCTVGIDIANPNSSLTHWDTVSVVFCDVGFRTNSYSLGTNWNFGGNKIDLLVLNSRRLSLREFTSESSTQIAVVENNASLFIEQAGIQVTNLIPASRIIIDAGQGTRLELRDSLISDLRGAGAAPWKLRQRNTGGAGRFDLLVDNVLGFDANNLDVQTVGEGLSAQHRVTINRPPNGPMDWGVRDVVYLTNGENYEENRNDFPGKVNVIGGPLTAKKLLTPSGLVATPTGSGRTTYSYKVSALSGVGETLASSAVTCTNAALDSTHFNEITWFAVIGADAYRVYGRTGGSERLLGTVFPKDVNAASLAGHSTVTYFKDDGSVTPNGALPSIDKTGTVSLEGTGFFSDGTEALPGVSFNGDPDTGIARLGPDDILIVAGGLYKIRANSSSVTMSQRTDMPGGMTVGGGATVNKIISASATLDFGKTPGQTSADLTITVKGAALGDVVSVGVPHASVAANSSFSAWVSAADTVTVRFNNYSTRAIDPAKGSFRAQVTRF